VIRRRDKIIKREVNVFKKSETMSYEKRRNVKTYLMNKEQ
jgi:hypothetical protein